MEKHVRGQIIGHKDNGEGYEFGGGAGFGDFYEGPLKMGELADNATITIHDGPHERVFTESEVKAIAMQAIGMIRSAAKTGIHVGQACGYIGAACGDAGIVLDPA